MRTATAATILALCVWPSLTVDTQVITDFSAIVDATENTENTDLLRGRTPNPPFSVLRAVRGSLNPCCPYGPAAGQEIPTTGGVVPPSVIKEVKPTYPEAALAAGISGTVTLECLVKADGTVGDARVIEPLDPLLDEQALKAVREWRFKPGTRDGKPADVTVTIDISFSYQSRGPKLGSAEVFKPGEGVTTPRVVRDSKPSYSPEAMRERVEGEVTIECVVLPDGTVGDARIVKSLHPQLDRDALKTAREWRFEPGMKDDKPVPVQVTITMTFTLK